MLVVKREGRLVVIELEMLPGLGVVARGAVSAEATLVRLLRLVATDTVSRSFAERLLRLVAALAGKAGMRSQEREVGGAVIELLAAELHDVGVASLVLGMAGPALCRLNPAQAAMEAGVGCDIGAYRLVARNAQLRLARAIAAVVTVLAILLVLGMRSGQLSRHEQGFGIHGFTALRGQQPHCERRQQDCAPWNCH